MSKRISADSSVTEKSLSFGVVELMETVVVGREKPPSATASVSLSFGVVELMETI